MDCAELANQCVSNNYYVKETQLTKDNGKLHAPEQ